MILEVGKHYQIDNLTKCVVYDHTEKEYEFRVSNSLLLFENNTKPILSVNRVKLMTSGSINFAQWFLYSNETIVGVVPFFNPAMIKDNFGFFSFTVEEILSEQDVDIDTAIHELLPSYTRFITNPSNCEVLPSPLGDRVLSSSYYNIRANEGYTLRGVHPHPIGTILASTMPIGWTENLVMNLDDYINLVDYRLLTPYGFSGDISFLNGAVEEEDVTISWNTTATGYHFDGYEDEDSITLPTDSPLQLVIKPDDDVNFHFTEESAYIFDELNWMKSFYHLNITVNEFGYLIVDIGAVYGNETFETPDAEELNVKLNPIVDGFVANGSYRTTPELDSEYTKYNQPLTIDFAPRRILRNPEFTIESFTMDGIDISNLIDIEQKTITIENVTGDINFRVGFIEKRDINFYNKNDVLEYTYVGGSRSLIKIEESLGTIRFIINGVLVHSYAETLEENERLVGFGTQDGELVFPINVEVPYTTYTDQSFYPIIVGDEPETNFTLQLFHMKGEKNLVDKTSVLEPVSTITGILRESCSVNQPSITCEFSEVPTFNYVYIPSMKRFYFVTEITFVSKNIYEVSLHVDVLMTYRNQIKSLKGIVARNEFDFNNLIEDANRQIERTKSIDVVDINKDNVFTESGDGGVYILQVVAGEGVL